MVLKKKQSHGNPHRPLPPHKALPPALSGHVTAKGRRQGLMGVAMGLFLLLHHDRAQERGISYKVTITGIVCQKSQTSITS